MSDRGRFSGFNWHMEYHTTDRKKEKAANCIYLTNDRICECKKSVYYLEKCFDSTHCPHRVKEEISKFQAENKPKATNSIPTKSLRRCSLPIGTEVYSKRWGEGALSTFDPHTGKITVLFGMRVIPFLYPDAFVHKHLTTAEEHLEKIEKDIQFLLRR